MHRIGNGGFVIDVDRVARTSLVADVCRGGTSVAWSRRLIAIIIVVRPAIIAPVSVVREIVVPAVEADSILMPATFVIPVAVVVVRIVRIVAAVSFVARLRDFCVASLVVPPVVVGMCGR